MHSRLMLLVALSVLAPPLASAKCALQQYKIEGRIAVHEALTSLIRIYPFLEGEEHTALVPDGSESPWAEFIVPEADGSFVAVVWLSTDSGTVSSGRDKCTRKAEYVDIFITGDGLRVKRTRALFSWVANKLPTANAGLIDMQRVKR